jgi:hypothetical protein
MSKHTPGPWTIDKLAGEGVCEIVAGDDSDTYVATCYADDAPLIAAAPELLEALTVLVDVCPCQNGCGKDDMTCATMKARAAIAKATGADS